MKLDERIGRRVRIARSLPRYPLADPSLIGRTGVVTDWQTGPDRHTTHWRVAPDGTDTTIACEVVVWGKNLDDYEYRAAPREDGTARSRASRHSTPRGFETTESPVAKCTVSNSAAHEPGASWRSGCDSLPERLVLDGAVRFDLASGGVVDVPRARVTFRPWRQDITIHTWGNKPVLDVAGEQTFAEVALVRLFEASGWKARWLETYCAPSDWPLELRSWNPAGIKAREIVPLGDAVVVAALRRIVALNDGKCAGCWDLVAWRGDALVFCELKHSGKDRMRDTQLRWVRAALRAGFTAEHFVIVDWRKSET